MNMLASLGGRLSQFAIQVLLLSLITKLLSTENASVVFVTLLVVGGASLFLISPLANT